MGTPVSLSFPYFSVCLMASHSGDYQSSMLNLCDFEASYD
jgi:hypothetical protein